MAGVFCFALTHATGGCGGAICARSEPCRLVGANRHSRHANDVARPLESHMAHMGLRRRNIDAATIRRVIIFRRKIRSFGCRQTDAIICRSLVSELRTVCGARWRRREGGTAGCWIACGVIIMAARVRPAERRRAVCCRHCSRLPTKVPSRHAPIGAGCSAPSSPASPE